MYGIYGFMAGVDAGRNIEARMRGSVVRRVEIGGKGGVCDCENKSLKFYGATTILDVWS